jgi:hypothetical protein
VAEVSLSTALDRGSALSMVGYLLLGTARLSPGKIGFQAHGLPRTTRLKDDMKKPPGPSGTGGFVASTPSIVADRGARF